ncbi:MAG TPA: hypothetical protein VH183_12790 [Burkholderiaceae bacterium]|jgi:hypothetical protein|nr:hypothetical protein [Burkholderiaceae bacterium]
MDLEVVDALRAAGVPDDKARAVVVSLHREIDQRYALHAAQLVTRGDLAETAGSTRVEMVRLHAESMAATGRLETKLAETRAELIRWYVASSIAMAGVIIAASRLMPH